MEPEIKDEKTIATVLITDADSAEVDFRDKDEALRLVGLERTAQFSEEYYAKLRRKFVSLRHTIVKASLLTRNPQDFVIPPLCAAVYCTQYQCVAYIAPMSTNRS